MANNLRSLCAQRGLTMTELAARCGTHYTVIYKITTEKIKATAARIAKIAGILGVTVEELGLTPASPRARAQGAAAYAARKAGKSWARICAELGHTAPGLRKAAAVYARAVGLPWPLLRPSFVSEKDVRRHELVRQGKTMREAARAENVALSNMSRWAQANGVTFANPIWSTEKDAHARKLQAAGVDFHAAKKELGIGRCALHSWETANGLRFARPAPGTHGVYVGSHQLSPEEHARRHALVQEGLTTSEAARRLGMNQLTLRLWAQSQGVRFKGQGGRVADAGIDAARYAALHLTVREASELLQTSQLTLRAWARSRGVSFKRTRP